MNFIKEYLKKDEYNVMRVARKETGGIHPTIYIEHLLSREKNE